MRKSLSRREFLKKSSAGLTAASVVPRGARLGGNPNALALKGGTPVRTKPFPSWPQTDKLDEENVLKALRNHRWCTYDGEFTPRFEKAWAAQIGAQGCVMTPCGTHALHMALNLVGVGPGDEVVVAPFTYIATIDVILMCYALPVFADTDRRTFQIDPDDVERRITEHTRAILPVHISGAPANMDKILAIAKKHNLPVVEDACQAHTAEWRGKRVGTLGTVGCFSFQETKVLPAGEGGAFVSTDRSLIESAYLFRDFGWDPKRRSYAIRATKFRQSEFAAAVLLAQLTRLESVCAVREKHGSYLLEEMRKIPGIYPQENYGESTRQTYLEIVFRYDQTQFHGLPRSKLIEALNAEGIPAGVSYPPLNREPFIEETLNSRAYRTVFSKERLDRYREQNHCPNNDELCATSVFLDQHVLIGAKTDLDDILEAVAKVQKLAGTS